MTTATGDGGRPYSVAIVAMGPSRADYIEECTRMSSRHAVADETWAINAMAGVIQHDRAVIMDDLRYFAKAARENKALEGYKDWLHKLKTPVYTSRADPELCPGSVDYPLQEVLAKLTVPYFNSTVAYALGLAIWMGVKELKLYGMDFNYGPEGRGFAEAGRACVEYWIRDAEWRGMKVKIAPGSTLCDQKTGRVLYGYAEPPGVREEG